MARRVVLHDDTGDRYTVAPGTAGQVLLSDGTKPVWGLGDLPDVVVSAASATLALSVRSCTTGAGPYTSPAPAATVTSPPQMFAIRNDATTAVTLQLTNKTGVVLPITIFPGESRTYRQSSTSGYSIQEGTPLRYLDERFLTEPLVVLLTGATTLTAHTWARCNPTGAAFTVTLPTAPYDGAHVQVENTGTANIVTVARGGTTDTIESATTLDVTLGSYVDLTYRVADTTWYRRRRTPDAIAGTDVRRNAAGQVSVAAPSASDHAATKASSDATAYPTVTARSGQYQFPPAGAMGNQTSASSGRGCTMHLDVGPNPDVFDALVCNVTTAQSGGTGTFVKGAVYYDDGTRGAPLLTPSGLIASVTFTVTSTGAKVVTFGTALTLQPGRYWLMGLYYQGSSAPTTAPLLTSPTGGLAYPNSTFSYARYQAFTGLTDLPVANQAVTPSGDANGIVIALRAA